MRIGFLGFGYPAGSSPGPRRTSARGCGRRSPSGRSRPFWRASKSNSRHSGSSTFVGSAGPCRSAGLARAGTGGVGASGSKLHVDRRQRPALLGGDAQAEDQPVLEVRRREQQDHRDELLVAVGRLQVGDLGVGDERGVERHLPGEFQGVALARRPAIRPGLQVGDLRFATPARRRSASAVARAYSQRLASAATQRILPRATGRAGSRPVQAVEVEHRGRGPRQVAAVGLAQFGSRWPPPRSPRQVAASIPRHSGFAQGAGRGGGAASRAAPIRSGHRGGFSCAPDRRVDPRRRRPAPARAGRRRRTAPSIPPPGRGAEDGEDPGRCRRLAPATVLAGLLALGLGGVGRVERDELNARRRALEGLARRLDGEPARRARRPPTPIGDENRRVVLFLARPSARGLRGRRNRQGLGVEVVGRRRLRQPSLTGSRWRSAPCSGADSRRHDEQGEVVAEVAPEALLVLGRDRPGRRGPACGQSRAGSPEGRPPGGQGGLSGRGVPSEEILGCALVDFLDVSVEVAEDGQGCGGGADDVRDVLADLLPCGVRNVSVTGIAEVGVVVYLWPVNLGTAAVGRRPSSRSPGQRSAARPT